MATLSIPAPNGSQTWSRREINRQRTAISGPRAKEIIQDSSSLLHGAQLILLDYTDLY